MTKIYYDHNCKCPICEIEYKTKKVQDKEIKVKTTDTDLCKYYEGPNPCFYEINVCPNCGFSFNENYKFRLGEEKINAFVSLFAPRWSKRDYSQERDINQAIEAFKLALVCGNIAEIKKSNMGMICMKLCWLYRISKNTEEETKFLKGAIDYFHDAFENESFDSEESTGPETIVYLLGELSYRIDDYESAKKWFNLGISKYLNKDNVNKKIANMLRDRWQEIKNDVV